ncbi:MAG: alpha/beta fold hydrolase [Alphaproteobacteria bacterium]|nr:alpha/beta fold hydrolase [Alphaproteobacteria bacterium]
MTTYVLVHGSFQGGWIWQPTASILRAEGHTVYVPTLDGCAERKVNLRAGITVSSVAQELADALFYEDLSDIVLVGTSSGGLVVEKTAVLVRDRIERLVFLDALVPQPGESVGDIVERPPGAVPYETTEFTRGPSRDAFENGLFSELKGDTKAWALDRATPHPIGLSDQQPGELDAFWDQSWAAKVIYCTESANPPESHQRRTADRLSAEWVEMTAGHYPMLTHPEETARLL